MGKNPIKNIAWNKTYDMGASKSHTELEQQITELEKKIESLSKEKEEYRISNKDKLGELSFPGNYLSLTTTSCKVYGEGWHTRPGLTLKEELAEAKRLYDMDDGQETESDEAVEFYNTNDDEEYECDDDTDIGSEDDLCYDEGSDED